MYSNSPTHRTDTPNITIRPANHEISEPFLSQTRESFDVEDEVAVDDESDESEGGFELVYKKGTKKYLETTKEDRNPKHNPNNQATTTTTKTRDFAPFSPPLRNAPRAPFARTRLPIRDVPECLPSPGVEQSSSPQPAHSLSQDAAQPLHGNIPGTPLLSRLESPDLSDLASFANEMDLFDGSGPEWARSPQVSEGFRPVLTHGERRSDESLVVPLSAVLRNLSSLNGLGEGLLIDDGVSLSEPISDLGSSPQRDSVDGIFAIGSASDSSENLGMPVFVTLPRALSEGNEPGRLHLPRTSEVDYHAHTSSSDSPSNTQSNLNIWFEIAYAIGVPAKASHHLTTNVLRYLREDTMAERSARYTNCEISQGALRRDEILAWINSGALDHGIDGDMNGRPFIVSLPSLWGSEFTDYWSFEYVDMYWRAQPGKFMWVMNWVQDVEGSAGDGESLTDEVYDFFGEDEEIVHRSVSKPKDDSEELSEGGQDGGVLIDPTSRPNPRLQMISDLFRVRELRRLEMDDGSPIFPMISPNEFRKIGGPGDNARTKALNLSERIARDADQRQERLMDGLFPRVINDEPLTIEGAISDLSGPITMGAFLGPQFSERDNETSQDPATKNGPSPTKPGTGDLLPPTKNKFGKIAPLSSDMSTTTPEIAIHRQKCKSSFPLPYLHPRLQTQNNQTPHFSVSRAVGTRNIQLQAHNNTPHAHHKTPPLSISSLRSLAFQDARTIPTHKSNCHEWYW